MTSREITELIVQSVRPFVITITTLLYNLVCCYEVMIGDMTVRDYILIAGPSNALLVGYWFGEQSRSPRDKR